MRPLPTCLALIMLSSAAFSQAWAGDVASPERALRQWAEALKSSDVDRVTACYEASDDVGLILSWGQMRTGTDAIRKEYEAAFDEVRFEEVDLDSLSVRESGGVAWAVCRFKAGTVRRSDQTRWRLDIRTTFVLKRNGETWRIVLEHSSPIAGASRSQRRD